MGLISVLGLKIIFNCFTKDYLAYLGEPLDKPGNSQWDDYVLLQSQWRVHLSSNHLHCCQCQVVNATSVVVITSKCYFDWCKVEISTQELLYQFRKFAYISYVFFCWHLL